MVVQELEQIECKQGMLAKGIKPDDLPVKMWRGAKVRMLEGGRAYGEEGHNG